MRITVFTSNQPRHLALINRLAAVADTVWAIQECTTVFPGQVEDFYQKNPVMQRYFSAVMQAEAAVFGPVSFLAANVRSLSIKSGDLNKLALDALAPALATDLVVVFGASYIRSPLIDHLMALRAVNIHMGVSPFYRGNSCNFWAAQQGNFHLIGSTIHQLSAGLDSGGILFHAMPAPDDLDPMMLGMVAVDAAQRGLVSRIQDGSLLDLPAVEQDRSQELLYSRRGDFTDSVADEYLDRMTGREQVGKQLRNADRSALVAPVYYESRAFAADKDQAE